MFAGCLIVLLRGASAVCPYSTLVAVWALPHVTWGTPACRHDCQHQAHGLQQQKVKVKFHTVKLMAQEEEERAQWDRVVQEKAAREEELERSFMAQAAAEEAAAEAAQGQQAKQQGDEQQAGQEGGKRQASRQGDRHRATPKDLPGFQSSAANRTVGLQTLERAVAEHGESSAGVTPMILLPCAS